jgi:hypothetical protein
MEAIALEKAGKPDEAMALNKSIPLEPWLAKILEEKVGVDYLRQSGWNLSEAEMEFGTDWLN